MSTPDIDRVMQIAHEHHQAGRRAQAELLYQQILTRMPDHPGALHGLGLIAMQSKQFDVAVGLLRRACAQKMDAAAYHANLGGALFAQRRTSEAIESYRRSLALDPGVAGTHAALATAFFWEGAVDEAIASYRNAVALKPSFAEAHHNLGNVLASQGNHREAIESYKKALQWKPDSVESYKSVAKSFLQLGMFEEAAANYALALRLRADDAEAHNNRGIALRRLGRLEEASLAYSRSLELQPDAAEVCNNLGNVLGELGKLDDAVVCYRRALEKQPDYANAHRNLANALVDCRDLELAEHHFDDAIRLAPNDDEAHLGRAMLWLLQGDYKRGWPEYEWRWKSHAVPFRSRALARPRWRGQNLGSQTLLLSSEQGFGDTLQFIRYVQKVSSLVENVVVECQPPLKRLLEASLRPNRVVDYNEELPPFEYHCPLLSLPTIFATDLTSIPNQVPYVRADEATVTKWRGRFANEPKGLKVGLAWAGSKYQVKDRNRSMSVAALAPLGTMTWVHWYSLQKSDEKEATLSPDLSIVDWTEEFKDFADTAAVIAQLDLVISVDTAVCHLAGALGKPVWTLLSFAADWRYLLHRHNSPWYPTMRLFRQTSLGDWAGVVEQVVTHLCDGKNALQQNMISEMSSNTFRSPKV
jgi:tetratricopeptide (TPR) repeat protein